MVFYRRSHRLAPHGRTAAFGEQHRISVPPLVMFVWAVLEACSESKGLTSTPILHYTFEACLREHDIQECRVRSMYCPGLLCSVALLPGLEPLSSFAVG